MRADQLMDDGALGVGDASRFAGLGRTTLYGLMSAGKLAYTKIGSRRLIPKKALIDLLATNLRGQSDDVSHDRVG